MGKLGVLSLAVAAGALTALLPAREAAAQDFGQSWIDRITHETEQDRGPLSPKRSTGPSTPAFSTSSTTTSSSRRATRPPIPL